MFDLMFHWSEWIKPSAGLPTVQWALLLAVAAATGHGLQRRWGLPKVLGYSVIGALAGFSGYTTASWPLDGIAQFLIELGLSIVLFEAGGRLSLRWLRLNPLLLVQSVVETLITYLVALWVLRLYHVDAVLQHPLALLLTTTSPGLLMRVVHDMRASGPVTDRAITLSTLNTFYVLALGGVMARLVGPIEGRLEGPGMGNMLGAIPAVLLLVFTSVLVGALLALALRKVLAWMSPSSENTAVLQLALIAAGTALAAHFGGSAPLAALLAGVLLKAWNPRPWIWPRQFGTAASVLSILTFVLVAMAAAQAPWQWQAWSLVLALALTRGVARIGGLSATTLLGMGSGASPRQAFWAANALWPMSAVALLLISQFAEFTPTIGAAIAAIALPLLLLLELLGALLMTWTLNQTREAGDPPNERAIPTDAAAPPPEATSAPGHANPSTQDREDLHHGA
ncbi:sodium:proton exchanger [Hylemonella gracilis]|uniref:Sodium:proton exchanger n=1 Tax=Hylemonella gracilis TaxID=80880 RepID=A0A4P6UMH4_9BURK|nr:cation:proton antiporter [Hylemonella gracilis]QBK05277.1 sodium:proton exchanger [Hylemonella gracilis]